MAVSRESKLINRTFQYVSKHMADPIAIGDILQELAVNKTNLERSFRKVLNYTPQRAILRFKIERSMEMLQHGESIKTIAKDLGFNSLYHFSNTFKRITGIRPTEYLKRKR
jgi:AraC-like DNA-binding protein